MSTSHLGRTAISTCRAWAGTARREARARTRTSTAGSRGFTLLELLLVVAIMAAAAVVVGPRLASWYDNFAFRDKVSRFAATLNLARVEAMRQGEPIVLSGLEGGHSLMVGKKLVDFGPSARILRLGSPWAPEEDGLVRIFFYPDGSADGSEVELEGPAGVILIQIHPVTGRVFLTWADS